MEPISGAALADGRLGQSGSSVLPGFGISVEQGRFEFFDVVGKIGNDFAFRFGIVLQEDAAGAVGVEDV